MPAPKLILALSMTLPLFGCSEVKASEKSSVASFSDGMVADCMISSNIIQQDAMTKPSLITDAKLRRSDFLLRDEWLRRISKVENKQEFSAQSMKSDFATKMLGNLNDFDFLTASKEQFQVCSDLIASLETRLLSEVSQS